MSDILYRPNLDYEKKYNTDAIVTGDIEVTDQSSESTKAQVSDIIDSIDRLESVVSSLPKSLASVVLVPLEAIRTVANTLDENIVNRPTTTKTIISVDNTGSSTTIAKDVDIVTGLPELPDNIFPSVPDVSIKIEEGSDPTYDNDMHNIIQDYINTLNVRINEYISNVATVIPEISISKLSEYYKPYTGKASDMKSADLQHISDMLVKSQIIRDQKIRLYKKLFDDVQTLMHVQSCKVASDLRERYKSEKYLPNEKDYNDFNRNMMLSDSRVAYEKKYKENFYNLYKYLNSSVILFNECLNLLVREIQCKSILERDNK